MKKIIAVIFFSLLACDIYFIATGKESLRVFSKPLLMPLLALGYVLATKKSNIYFVLALFFSFGGDMFLLNPKEYFVFGLGSFLLTHFLYFFIIYKFLKYKEVTNLLKWLLPFVAYFGMIVFLIYPNLGSFLAPVIVYGSVIALFGMVSLVNYLQDKSKINLLLLLGAILFIISDSCIALDKFYESSVTLRILVMVLYGLSQYLITRVMIIKNNVNND